METEFSYDQYEEEIEDSNEDDTSDGDDSSSDETTIPVKKQKKVNYEICKINFDEIRSKAGTLVSLVENNVITTGPTEISDPISVYITEAKSQLNITFDLTDIQLKALYSLAQLKDTIVNIGTGEGKSMIYYLSIVILGKILNIPKPIGLCLQPTNDLSEDKLQNPVTKTAFLTRSGDFRLSTEKTEFSEPRDAVECGDFPAVVCSGEIIACSDGQQFLKKIESHLVVGCLDDGHLFNSDQWGDPSFRGDMSEMPRNIRGLLRKTGAPFLILSATESKADIKITKRICDLEKNTTLIRSSPVLHNHMFINIKSPPDCNSFFGTPDGNCGTKHLLDEIYFREFIDSVKSGTKPKKAILFVQKIKDLNAINDYLNKELKGKVDPKAKPWVTNFSGKGHVSKVKLRERLKANDVSLIVTTSVMLVGIDFPDIQIVIILRPFSHLSSFIQAAGRGGRRRKDNTRALVPVFSLFNNTDISKCQKHITESVRNFLQNDNVCKKKLLHDYFQYHKEENYVTSHVWCCNVCSL